MQCREGCVNVGNGTAAMMPDDCLTACWHAQVGCRRPDGLLLPPGVTDQLPCAAIGHGISAKDPLPCVQGTEHAYGHCHTLLCRNKECICVISRGESSTSGPCRGAPTAQIACIIDSSIAPTPLWGSM